MLKFQETRKEEAESVPRCSPGEGGGVQPAGQTLLHLLSSGNWAGLGAAPNLGAQCQQPADSCCLLLIVFDGDLGPRCWDLLIMKVAEGGVTFQLLRACPLTASPAPSPLCPAVPQKKTSQVSGFSWASRPSPCWLCRWPRTGCARKHPHLHPCSRCFVQRRRGPHAWSVTWSELLRPPVFLAFLPHVYRLSLCQLYGRSHGADAWPLPCPGDGRQERRRLAAVTVMQSASYRAAGSGGATGRARGFTAHKRPCGWSAMTRAHPGCCWCRTSGALGAAGSSGAQGSDRAEAAAAGAAACQDWTFCG